MSMTSWPHSRRYTARVSFSSKPAWSEPTASRILIPPHRLFVRRHYRQKTELFFLVERVSRSGARTTGVHRECPDKPVCHEREATKSRDQAQQAMRVSSSAFRLHWSGAG